MNITIGKEYRTLNNLPAIINYVQPLDVFDEFPVIGFVVADGVKVGMCWSKTGEAGEASEFDLKEEQ